MYYEKFGIAILRPRMIGNKLDTLDAELIKSTNITPQACKEMGGRWIDDPTGLGCKIEIHDIVDVALDDIVFGRILTDIGAPEEFIKTEEFTIKAKRGAFFQFDCGYGTSDLNIETTHLQAPTKYMERHYLKSLDMACKRRPSGASSTGILAKSGKGIVAVYPSED